MVTIETPGANLAQKWLKEHGNAQGELPIDGRSFKDIYTQLSAALKAHEDELGFYWERPWMESQEENTRVYDAADGAIWATHVGRGTNEGMYLAVDLLDAGVAIRLMTVKHLGGWDDILKIQAFLSILLEVW